MSQSEDGDSLYVDKLFKAISNKDEQGLAYTLQHSTIETILKFKLRYGHSPLAYCCTQPSAVSHLGLMRCLLESGLYDSEMIVDDESHTVLAKLAAAAAQAQNDQSTIGLLKHIIQIVIDGVDDRTACYRILKHNSLDLFRMFLAIKQYSETRLFECLAWAVTKLNVKRFPLATNLRMFVLWKLSDYGYRHLSGNGPTKSTDEWKDQIDVMSDCWSVIAKKYDTGMYEDVDDRLLYRLHVMHNHLYFLQHKPFLDHLPLREAIFCLAIFVNIYNQCAKFEVYRFLVNKRLVVDAMRMISFQLALAKNCVENTELELVSLMKAGESFIAERKNRLMAELVQRIELMGMGGNPQERMAGSNSKDTIIKSMLQKLKKVDKRWSESKMVELKAMQQTHRDHLITLLESRLEYVQHPQNVACRIMARTKRTDLSDSEIVAEIVASESIDLEHLMRGKDRRIRRKIRKCYDAMKQLYSLNKVVTTFARVPTVDPANVEVFHDCLKRAVTVLGETLKNTKSTPNMPNGRLIEAMERMLTEAFADTVIFHRNNYAREFSLPKLLVDGELERRIYSVLPHHTAVIRMAISLLLVIVLAETRRSFYGTLVRCSSLRELRTLLIFAGVRDVMFELQQGALQDVQKYFSDAKKLFAELRGGLIGQTCQFLNLEKHFLVQCSIVEELEVMVASESELNFESLRATCFSCHCIATIRSLLHWKIDSFPTPYRLLETICTKWDPCVTSLSHLRWLDPRLTWLDPTSVASKLALLQGAIVSASESHYLSRTREMIEQLAGHTHDRIDEAAVQLLNKMLRPYYENIFFLDNKWKVLESFCRQRLGIPWNTAHVRTLRQADQQYLQTLFDERRAKLRSILEQNDIRTVDVLHVGAIILQQDILASLEHLQLELCEMLTTVGYFGDSFHYVKHRIPMIQGKNYRNLLAHDSMSYNLLTDSGDAKLIVNAYIFANTEVCLFDSRKSSEQQDRQLRFPTLEDTATWVEKQEQLLGAIKSNNPAQLSKLIRSSGGEIKSLFCSSPNVDHYPATYLSIVHHVQGIAVLDPSISAYLSLYIPNYQSLRDDPKYLLESAIIRRDFEAAVKFLDAREPFPREEFYSWPDALSNPCTEVILTKAALKRTDALAQLLDWGNEKCFMKLTYICCKEFVATEEYQEIVCKAILRGARSCANFLARKACRLGSKALEWTIVLHWNDLLRPIVAKTDIDDDVFLSLLRTSIKANNDTALRYFLQPKRQWALDIARECYQTASTFGRCNVLKYLLEKFPPSTLDSSVLSTAIHRGALNNHWECVRLLLDTGARVDVHMQGYQDAESNVLLLLALYNQVALVRKVKTIDRSIYGTVAEHPFSVALRAETASSRMVRALAVLGFSWLDSSTILHEAITQGYEQSGWNIIWREIDDQLATIAVSHPDHSAMYLRVLQRWRTIAFVEEFTTLDGSNAPCCAAQTGDSQMLRALLERSFSVRRIDDIGVLGNIVFLVDSTTVEHCKIAKNGRWNVVSCCDDMIGRIKTFHSTSDEKIHLKKWPIDVGAMSINFIVPAYAKIKDCCADVSFRDSSSMMDNLHDLRNITDSMFINTPQTPVYATFSKNASHSTHFLRIENVCCLYDMYKPDSRVIDLADILNSSGTEGKTVLQLAIEAQCEQELVQQLVQMGANPLLPDSYGTTPIHSALDHPARTLVLYLLDECLQRNLRNADGVGLFELTDGICHNTLLHTATTGGNQTVVARLLKLPEPSTTVKNIFGQTPAHIAATVPFINTISLMKLLLDYDRFPVDMEDVKGATLLQLAAKADSIEMLDLVMEYEPNLALQSNRIALYEAIRLQQVQWAKGFLHHALRKGAREVTKLEDDGDDPVIMSLNCADFELSRALLEYELGHRLEDITVHDRPRIERVLKGSTRKIPQVSVELQLKLRGLNEADNFLTYLRNLLDTHASAGYSQ